MFETKKASLVIKVCSKKLIVHLLSRLERGQARPTDGIFGSIINMLGVVSGVSSTSALAETMFLKSYFKFWKGNFLTLYKMECEGDIQSIKNDLARIRAGKNPPES